MQAEQEATKSYTIQGATKYLGLTDDYQLYQAIRDGQLIATKPDGRRWNITQEVLNAYWDTHIAPLHTKPSTNGTGHQASTEEVTLTHESEEGVEATSEVVEEVPSSDPIAEEVPVQVEEIPAPAPTGSASVQPQTMICCHRCLRPFSDASQYVFAQFTERGGPAFYPVCKDARCDPALVNALKERDSLIAALMTVRTFVDKALREHEGKSV